MYIYHEIIKINDINDREEILDTLSCVETDEDFNGNNGEEFTREDAIKSGFKSTQAYIVNKLRASDLEGYELIIEFFKEWLDNDGYYDTWNFKGSNEEEDGSYVCSVVAIHED